MAAKKLSKKALNKSLWLWFHGHLTCFTYEHMQTFGYMCSMLPLIEELYDSKEEQKEALTTYSSFFNTEPQLGGSLVVGVTAGLEEARANGEEVDGDLINGIRAGLMGPLAGIGDSIVVGTLIPLLLGIALSMSTNGSPLGAVFYIVAWNLISVLGMRFLYYKGYNLGEKAVALVVGESAMAIREAIIMVGTIVIGAVAATWINITTSLVIVKKAAGTEGITLQSSLDGIYPKILNVVFVLLCWWLMSKKKMSPLATMAIMLAVAFVGVLVGFFNPGLSY